MKPLPRRAPVRSNSISRRCATGAVSLDAPAAEAAADQYLATIGRSGTVTVNGDEVSVIVSFRQPTDLLGLAGIGSFAVSGSGSATATEGP
jgi:hypothetical protein